jgi:hypothetical protein
VLPEFERALKLDEGVLRYLISLHEHELGAPPMTRKSWPRRKARRRRRRRGMTMRRQKKTDPFAESADPLRRLQGRPPALALHHRDGQVPAQPPDGRDRPPPAPAGQGNQEGALLALLPYTKGSQG